MLDDGADDTVAAYDTCHRKLVIVTVNAGPSQSVTYDLSRFAISQKARDKVDCWTSTGDGRQRYASEPPVQLTGNQFTVTFPANSVKTFEVFGVDRPQSR